MAINPSSCGVPIGPPVNGIISAALGGVNGVALNGPPAYFTINGSGFFGTVYGQLIADSSQQCNGFVTVKTTSAFCSIPVGSTVPLDVSNVCAITRLARAL